MLINPLAFLVTGPDLWCVTRKEQDAVTLKGVAPCRTAQAVVLYEDAARLLGNMRAAMASERAAALAEAEARIKVLEAEIDLLRAAMLRAVSR